MTTTDANDQILITWLEDRLRLCFQTGPLLEKSDDLFFALFFSTSDVKAILDLSAKLGKCYTHKELSEIMGCPQGLQSERIKALESYVKFMKDLLTPPQETTDAAE